MLRAAVGLLLVIAILAVAAAVVWPRQEAGQRSVHVFAAAGLRKAVEDAAARFRADEGIDVHIEYGGSGDLETRLGVARGGDLYIPADSSFTARMRERGQVREILHLARQTPILAVRAGNPQGVAGLADAIARPGIRIGAPNPESASLGRLLQRKLTGDLAWDRLAPRLAVTKPTVSEIAADLATGAIDAALVWDAQLVQYPGIAAVAEPALAGLTETVTAGVLAWTAESALALRFARFLAAPETGNPIFAKHGYQPIPGDRWASQPQIVLFSGAVNRAAVGKLIDAFAEREGVRIATTFNGCGILCASMQAIQQGGAGQYPDGYYACDICFVQPVADQFPEAIMLTETEILIAVPKGNPQGIAGLADLARAGLRVGICNAEQSTLGYITGEMLKTTGLAKAVMPNVRSQVPTGDLLINQLLTGSLDAAVVYRTNVHQRLDKLEGIAIRNVPAKAVQPFAVWKDSPNKQLMGRLLDHLQANRASFTGAGFTWHEDQRMMPSADLPVPDYLRKDRAKP